MCSPRPAAWAWSPSRTMPAIRSSASPPAPDAKPRCRPRFRATWTWSARRTKGRSHNFDTDPIRLLVDGDWLKADGTTLGADNGVGVAAALAVMESDDVAHGPLEFVFTIDEESGLTGASRVSRRTPQVQVLPESRQRGGEHALHRLRRRCQFGRPAEASRAAPHRPGRRWRIKISGLAGRPLGRRHSSRPRQRPAHPRPHAAGTARSPAPGRRRYRRREQAQRHSARSFRHRGARFAPRAAIEVSGGGV